MFTESPIFPDQVVGRTCLSQDVPQEPSKCCTKALDTFEKTELTIPSTVNASVEEWIRSEIGVPTINNLEKLTARYHEKESKKPQAEKRTVLDEMIEKPRPRNGSASPKEIEELRMATIQQIRVMMAEKLVTIEQLDSAFDHPETLDFLKKLGLLSPSTATLLLVHLVLWGRSILKLGTEKHWKAYLEKSNNLDIMGCCMMTEIGHGSDVPGLETTATFDPETREFVLNTPTKFYSLKELFDLDLRTFHHVSQKEKAIKAFIGGAAKNATHGVLFARLTLNDIDYGVHAFVVEMRQNGQNMPGIYTRDMGAKRGLNGVDNGFVAFDHVRIPYDNLLNHYCDISLQGEYISKNGNKNPKTLIYKLMSQFVRGRQTIAFNTANSLAFLSAVFCCYPPAIGRAYHKRLMIDFLSKAFAIEFSKPIYLGENVEDHIAASMMKAVASQMGMDFFMEILRQYGRSPYSYWIHDVIEDFRKDVDATLTYEGDNMVLLQLVAKEILKINLQEFEEFFKFDISLSGLQKKWLFIRKAMDYQLNSPQQDPYHLLQRRVLDYVYEIGDKMKKGGASKDNPGRVLEIWNTQCQVDGIKMAEIFAQSQIIKQFYKKAKLLDQEQNTTKWSSLYEIYAWETCRKYALGVKIPDLSKQYAALAPDIYEMLSHFDFKMEWLHALIPPPKTSKSFEEVETAPPFDLTFSCAL